MKKAKSEKMTESIYTTLPPEIRGRLRALSKNRNVTESQIVREAVGTLLTKLEKNRGAARLSGRKAA